MKLGNHSLISRSVQVLILLAALPLLGVAWHAGPQAAPDAAQLADAMAREEFNLDVPRVFCFAPGTDPAIMAYYNELMHYDPYTRYELGNRWPGTQGDPISLSWSFVPDGVLLEGGVPSNLFATMDAKFGGNRALWVSKFQAVFDRWHALTGVTYQRITYNGNDWDDGASWSASGSSTRGDCRIGGLNIDGPGNVLAYDYMPGAGVGGNMVFDTSENWQDPANDYRFLRNCAMHEHGHGLGLEHSCPDNGTKLMEPYLNTNFDGPQHDDIRGAQRHYGDPYEANNTTGTATDLGTLMFGSMVVLGPVPSPNVAYGSVLSIDANGEVDWFKFTVTAEALMSVAVNPIGLYYDASPQNGDGTCASGNYIDSLSIADLNFQIIDTNGSTVIATAASQPAGSAESLTGVYLPGSGTYYVKVYEGNTPNETQLYQLSVLANTYDFDPPSPDPMSFDVPPHPTSNSTIAMTATTATDSQTPPVYYYFDFISGGPGGTDGYWTSYTTYTDSDLQANTEYTYNVKARDSATPPNETEPSPPVTTATYIETPTGTTLGTVTATSVEIFATGTFTNLTLGSSGLYFDCAGNCDGGINQWIQVNGDTADALQPDTYYTFRVKARNLNAVETGWSQFNASTYTLANVPGAPVLSNPTLNSLQIAVAPNGNPEYTAFAIQCSSTVDPAWNGKFVGATGLPVAAAVWQTAADWGTLTLPNLLSGTQYCFHVKAMNESAIETAFSPPACAQTQGGGGGLVGDLNCDNSVNFGDINPFVMYLSNFALWQTTFPGCPATNGDINGDGSYPSFADINPFVSLLTNP